MLKGFDREKSLDRSEYFNEAYFSLPQLFSFSHQIHLIHSLNPDNILEIGIGNGFVSNFLKNAGYRITTADINPRLKPDIVAPIFDLRNKINDSFDLVVCCEVLEHMPFEHFDECIKVISEISTNSLITLPSYKRRWGFNGILDLPRVPIRGFNINFSVPFYKKKLQDTAHFWEVGYNKQTTRDALVKQLKYNFDEVVNGFFHLNPYHEYFVCKKSLHNRRV